MEIKTERLILTEFTMEMAADVHRNSLDEDMRRFVPDEVFETIEDARAVLKHLIAQYDSEDGPYVYPVLLRGGANAGYVQLVKLGDGWEIGYHIAAKYTGHGYASEAVQAFLPVIAKLKGISEIWGICLADNAASEKVLEKSGFECVCTGTEPYQGEEREVRRFRWKNHNNTTVLDLTDASGRDESEEAEK
ncbi:MAG: GNAT family N-acetyltransferase [Clostridia bacterium]|nr:GNAT family N-acetyltransferase [Clostridia bacterium]